MTGPHRTISWIIFIAVLVLGVNLFMHDKTEAPEVEQYDPDSHPLVTMVLVRNALEAHADAHDGEYPGELGQLLRQGAFDDAPITPSVLEKFTYQRRGLYAFDLDFRDREAVLDAFSLPAR